MGISMLAKAVKKRAYGRRHWHHAFLCGVLCLALTMLAPACSAAHVATGVRALDMAAIQVKAPGQVVLISITNAGNRLVAVGEHGVIAYSDDSGTHWKQAVVPVDVTLTAVYFKNSMDGWAAGHYGVILHTVDGGATWQLELNGLQVNKLALAAAQTAVADNDPSPGTALAMKRANLFMSAGPDKPFLTIFGADPNDVIALGAYRIADKSTNNGNTWTDWSLHIGDPLSHNLYNVIYVGDEIYIVGEMGVVFRSTDGGKSFPEITSPCSNTLLTVLPTGDGGVFVAGVAGAAYRSADNGASWTSVNLGSNANLTAGIVLKSGALLLGSESGILYISRDHGQSFMALSEAQPQAIYGLAQAPDGNVIIVGNGGVDIAAASQFGE
jgi:photosystem II stability/assembly factor-like uncharacterized protein